MDSQSPTTLSASQSNGHGKTVLLSSNATIFWRVFVPFFVSSLLTALVIAFWFSDRTGHTLGESTVLKIQIGITAIWLFWLFWVRRTLWRLLRVDASDTHIYVTDYWKTVRYAWHDIVRAEEKVSIGKRIIHFHLRAPGTFGQVISFLPGGAYDAWRAENDFPPSVEN